MSAKKRIPERVTASNFSGVAQMMSAESRPSRPSRSVSPVPQSGRFQGRVIRTSSTEAAPSMGAPDALRCCRNSLRTGELAAGDAQRAKALRPVPHLLLQQHALTAAVVAARNGGYSPEGPPMLAGPASSQNNGKRSRAREQHPPAPGRGRAPGKRSSGGRAGAPTAHRARCGWTAGAGWPAPAAPSCLGSENGRRGRGVIAVQLRQAGQFIAARPLGGSTHLRRWAPRSPRCAPPRRWWASTRFGWR